MEACPEKHKKGDEKLQIVFVGACDIYSEEVKPSLINSGVILKINDMYFLCSLPRPELNRWI